MNKQELLWRATLVGALVSTATLLAACGGSNDDDDAATPSSFTITGKAVDGPLQGVTACYDLNDNKDCDAGEPTSAVTGADGSFSIAGIAPADVGKHLVLVDVPANAIDADTGAAVGRDFLNLWMYGRAAVSPDPGQFYDLAAYRPADSDSGRALARGAVLSDLRTRFVSDRRPHDRGFRNARSPA